MVHAELVISLLQLLELLLGGDELAVEKIHLLSGHNVFRHHVGLPGSRRLSSDVIEGILVVHLEVGVFEFPGLKLLATRCTRAYFQVQLIPQCRTAKHHLPRCCA